MKIEMHEIINSVGIEMEFMNVNRNDKGFLRDLNKELHGYRADHDASCESPIETFLNYPIVFESNDNRKKLAPFLGSLIVGGEIISPIRNSLSPNWVLEIEHLCKVLYEHGEREDTIRDSFHVHVNISRDVPLSVLKNLLLFCGMYEAFLYRLGGMGRINRGVENDFIYERPYLGNGPPVITLENNYPILDYDDLLASETKQEFFERYGNADYWAQRTTRYVTCRYMSVNFYPILTQGSIEFRTANKTLNPSYIIAWTNFCKAIVSTAFHTKKLAVSRFRPLYENRDIDIREFLEAIRILELDDDTLDVLTEIWELSPTPDFDNVWTKTHLRDAPNFAQTNYRPKPIEEDIKEANHVDVHMLQREQARNEVPQIPFRVEGAPFPRINLQPEEPRDFRGARMRDNFNELTDRVGPDVADQLQHSDIIPIENIPLNFEVMNDSVNGWIFYIRYTAGENVINCFYTFPELNLEGDHFVAVDTNTLFLTDITDAILGEIED